jgi:RecB family endonuclease NucS
MVVQNRYNPSQILPGTICAVIEVKSDKADHEVSGQLTKAVRVLDSVGKQTGFWESTTGIAIAPAFTISAIELLLSEKYTVLELVNHSSGFLLSPIKG